MLKYLLMAKCYKQPQPRTLLIPGQAVTTTTETDEKANEVNEGRMVAIQHCVKAQRNNV